MTKQPSDIERSWFELCKLLSNPDISTHKLLAGTVDLIPGFYTESKMVATFSFGSSDEEPLIDASSPKKHAMKTQPLAVEIPCSNNKSNGQKERPRKINIFRQNEDLKEYKSGDARMKLIAQLLGQALDFTGVQSVKNVPVTTQEKILMRHPQLA